MCSSFISIAYVPARIGHRFHQQKKPLTYQGLLNLISDITVPARQLNHLHSLQTCTYLCILPIYSYFNFCPSSIGIKLKNADDQMEPVWQVLLTLFSYTYVLILHNYRSELTSWPVTSCLKISGSSGRKNQVK